MVVRGYRDSDPRVFVWRHETNSCPAEALAPDPLRDPRQRKGAKPVKERAGLPAPSLNCSAYIYQADGRTLGVVHRLFMTRSGTLIGVPVCVCGLPASVGMNPRRTSRCRPLAEVRAVDYHQNVADRKHDILHPVGIDRRTNRDTPRGEE